MFCQWVQVGGVRVRCAISANRNSEYDYNVLYVSLWLWLVWCIWKSQRRKTTTSSSYACVYCCCCCFYYYLFTCNTPYLCALFLARRLLPIATRPRMACSPCFIAACSAWCHTHTHTHTSVYWYPIILIRFLTKILCDAITNSICGVSLDRKARVKPEMNKKTRTNPTYNKSEPEKIAWIVNGSGMRSNGDAEQKKWVAMSAAGGQKRTGKSVKGHSH